MKQDKIKVFVSAVVYVYNGAEYLLDCLKKLDSTLSYAFECAEIICVNDDSSDDSVDIIRNFAVTSESTISILNMSFHQGVESAMNAGVDLSIGDFVFEIESTQMIYPAETLISLYKKSIEGYDIVSLVPKKNRTFFSSVYYHFYNRFSHSQYGLHTELCRIVSRRTLNRIGSMSQTIPYRKAAYSNCGLKKTALQFEEDIPITKMSRRQKREYHNLAIDSIILYTDLAFNISIAFSIIMSLLMVTVATYALTIKLMGVPIAGWTSTILFLSVAFFGIFVILTMIVKYLSIILKLNFSKLPYITGTIEKLK